MVEKHSNYFGSAETLISVFVRVRSWNFDPKGFMCVDLYSEPCVVMFFFNMSPKPISFVDAPLIF